MDLLHIIWHAEWALNDVNHPDIIHDQILLTSKQAYFQAQLAHLPPWGMFPRMRDVLPSDIRHAQLEPGPFRLHDRLLCTRSLLSLHLETDSEVDALNLSIKTFIIQ